MPISRDPHDPVYNPAVAPLAEPVELDLERLSVESPAKQGKETYVLRPCAQGKCGRDRRLRDWGRYEASKAKQLASAVPPVSPLLKPVKSTRGDLAMTAPSPPKESKGSGEKRTHKVRMQWCRFVNGRNVAMCCILIVRLLFGCKPLVAAVVGRASFSIC